MAPFTGVPTYNQQVALAMAPKIPAALSILSSSYIVMDSLRRRRRHRDRSTYHHLLIGLSVNDVLMSAGLFTSTWFMPADTPNVFGAVGTIASCEAIGFVEQAGLAAVLYNGSLSFYYLFRIRYGWSADRIRRIEPALHLVPIVPAMSTMVACLALDLFNSGLFDCWIAPYPQGCTETWRAGYTDCERGDNASLYQWVFDVIPKWLSVLLVTANMFFTHRAVLQQERSTLRFRPSEDGFHPPKPKIARRLARQSYLYVGALWLTYIPVAMTRLTELLAGHVYYGMLLTIAMMLPLQGVWNLLVYLRPRYLYAKQQRKRQRRTSSSRLSSASRVFGWLQNVSEVVKEGALDEEDDNDSGDELESIDLYPEPAAGVVAVDTTVVPGPQAQESAESVAELTSKEAAGDTVT